VSVAIPTTGFQASGKLSPFPYALKYADADDVYSLDSPVYRLVVDEQAMSARNILATTVRDRQGDVLETDAVDFSEHRLNPVAFLDHGKTGHPLPIGLTRSPAGLYTVERLPGIITEETFFSQRSQVAGQLFGLIAEGILRGNSIGFRALEVRPLSPDPEHGFFPGKDSKGDPTPAGKHILRSKLLEVTWTGLPVNPEAAGKALSMRWDGKPLEPFLAETLSRHAPPRRLVVQGWRPLCKSLVATPAAPMSASDQSTGGAFVPPPTGGGHFVKLGRNKRAFKSGFKCSWGKKNGR
jgi:hypothetical protein